MKIIISDFFKDEVKALTKVNVQDELDYHRGVHGCKPSNVFILHPIEAMSDTYKDTKYTMVLMV